MKAIPQDLNNKIIAWYRTHGGSYELISEKFEVSASHVGKVLKQYRLRNEPGYIPRKVGETKYPDEMFRMASDLKSRYPHITGKEAHKRIKEMLNIEIAFSYFYKLLFDRGIRFNSQGKAYKGD